MPSSIVCGVDHSDPARQALRFADQLCERLGLQLILAHATSAPMPISSRAYGAATYEPNGYQAALDAGASFLEELAASEELADVRLRCELGSATHCLLQIADEEEAELIVVGSRRRGSLRAALLGSVSSTVATSAACPVVVVPTHPTRRGREERLGTIVCAVDDSDAARQALRVAGVLTSWLGARLVLAHVAADPNVPGVSAAAGAADELRRVEIEEGEELLAELAAAEQIGSSFERRVAFGTQGGTIADLAEEEDATLVVVGSRGHGPFRSALLGSTSSELIGSSPCPVVVVPPAVANARLDTTARQRGSVSW